MLTRSRRSQGRPPAAPAIPRPASASDLSPCCPAGPAARGRVSLPTSSPASGSDDRERITRPWLTSSRVPSHSDALSLAFGEGYNNQCHAKCEHARGHARTTARAPSPAGPAARDPTRFSRPTQTLGRTRRSRASRPGRTCALARAQPLRHRVSCGRECGAARQLPVEGPIRPARRAGVGEGGGRGRGATAPGRGRRPVERPWLRLPVDVRSRACRATEDMNNYMKKTYYNYTII